MKGSPSLCLEETTERCVRPRAKEGTKLHSCWRTTERRARLERTTLGHLVQSPCSSRVTPEHIAQNCIQTVLESPARETLQTLRAICFRAHLLALERKQELQDSKEKQCTSLFAFLNQTLLRAGLDQRGPTPTALRSLGGAGGDWNPESFATSFLSDPSRTPQFVPSPRQLPALGPGPTASPAPSRRPSDTAGKGPRGKRPAPRAAPRPARQDGSGAASGCRLRPSCLPSSLPPSRRPPLSPPPAVCAEAAGARDCGSGGDAEWGGDAAGAGGFRCGAQTCRLGPRSERRCPCPLGTAPGPGPARRRHGRDQQPRSREEAAGKHAGGPAGPEPGVPEKIPPRQGGEWRWAESGRAVLGWADGGRRAGGASMAPGPGRSGAAGEPLLRYPARCRSRWAPTSTAAGCAQMWLCPDVAVPVACSVAAVVSVLPRRDPWAGLCPSGLAGRPAVDGRSGGGPSAPWGENTKFGSAVSAPRSERNSPEASSALGLGRPERAGSPQGGLRPRRAVLSPGRPCGCRGSQGPAGLPSGLCLPPLSKAVVPGPGALFLSIAHPWLPVGAVAVARHRYRVVSGLCGFPKMWAQLRKLGRHRSLGYFFFLSS